ncbi:micrococcal nuclease [Nitrosomonas ureae]|uniref:thermonuclease family protein n=1 Tax=Nitrosomonas ureae TaxID=44577 RepID=UPI000D765C3F|nr:thermonuclease family protein [Nitrosomonas ureae]PXX11394.1 micrococcal nuclease [Nitrosomonas ureae]
MLSTPILCFIIAILSGDIVVANCDHHQIVIRIAEIDAPEKRQDFGLSSRQSLVELCLYKNAEVVKKTEDNFGHTVAYVKCSGKNAGTEQIKRGMAWVFDKYVTNTELHTLQEQAKSEHKGLWENPAPIPPWEWPKIE